MSDLERWREVLDLQPHPEGGWYRETFRSTLAVEGPRGCRDASTAIWYALPAGGFSALHRVAADEVWHHYDGGPVLLHLLDEDGRWRTEVLGRNWAGGARPQRVVPAGVWQAAEAHAGDVLCGCTVAPGFTFADFALADAGLIERFPQHRAEILRLIHKVPEGSPR